MTHLPLSKIAGFFTGFALSAALVCTPALADASLRERQLEAAMIFNFARFVEWPEQKSPQKTGTLVICYPSSYDAAPQMQELNGKTIGAAKVNAKAYDATKDDLSVCHVAYVDTQAAKSLSKADRPKGQTLTISDYVEGAAPSGMVELVRVGRQTRFAVNADMADQADLNISSKLLRLSVDIR